MQKIKGVKILNYNYLSDESIKEAVNSKTVEEFKKTYVYQSLKWHEAKTDMVGSMIVTSNNREVNIPLLEVTI